MSVNPDLKFISSDNLRIDPVEDISALQKRIENVLKTGIRDNRQSDAEYIHEKAMSLDSKTTLSSDLTSTNSERNAIGKEVIFLDSQNKPINIDLSLNNKDRIKQIEQEMEKLDFSEFEKNVVYESLFQGAVSLTSSLMKPEHQKAIFGDRYIQQLEAKDQALLTRITISSIIIIKDQNEKLKVGYQVESPLFVFEDGKRQTFLDIQYDFYNSFNFEESKGPFFAFLKVSTHQKN